MMLREIDLLGNKIINVHIKDRIRNGTTVPLELEILILKE